MALRYSSFIGGSVGRLQQIVDNGSNDDKIQRIETALPTLEPYQQFRIRSQKLGQESFAVLKILRGKEELLEAIPAASLEAEIRRILKREARLDWKFKMEQSEPSLLFDHSDIEHKVARLAELDHDMRELNMALLKENIDTSKIKPSTEWEDITRLNGPRAKRLREFIEVGIGHGLLHLRPVWLMNPDTASRILPLKSGLFDTVVYDEASQITVEYALPTLYRGRVSVVSGDEKQMPPSAFFTGKIENDEDDSSDGAMLEEGGEDGELETYEEAWNRREIKDCPDLLQLARTALPQAKLLIHYRSAYRELIGYSNACFYGNELSVPVRHPDTTVREHQPIEFEHVDGIYYQQTNPVEAKEAVEVLARLWQVPYDKRPSVGVVTFNRKQADLILDYLDRRAETDAGFREAYRQEQGRQSQDEDMSIFVKNVENVQGDERDVIVFSSTFGPNLEGKFVRKFGILGQKGGERRLNVAVTRARQKIVMITSLPVPEISDLLQSQRKPASPRDFLQAYMEYAKTVSGGDIEGSRALLERFKLAREDRQSSGNGAAQDGFSRDVAEFIQGLGYPIHSASDQDAFGLDFAIADPDTKLFAIGIECDAHRHDLLERARAREIWRPTVLRRAVPKLHRVSSAGWYHDPEKEKDRLRATIHSVLPPQEQNP